VAERNAEEDLEREFTRSSYALGSSEAIISRFVDLRKALANMRGRGTRNFFLIGPKGAKP
jgi:hypothetical protein